MNNEITLYRDPELASQNLALTGGSAQATTDDRVNFGAIASILRRRRTLFLSIFLAIFALGVILTVTQTRIYSASAQVVIDTSKEQVAPGNQEEVLQQGALSSAQVDTEVLIISSRAMANKVAESLNLYKSAAFDPSNVQPGKLARLRSFVTGAPLPVSRRAYDAQAQREFVIDVLQRGLKVTRTGVTYMLVLSYESADPDFAAAVVNEYGRQYALDALARKREANQNALTFLSKRLDGLRKQAQADNEAVQQYRVAHNLLSVNAAQLTEQEVSIYNQQVAGARAAAAEDSARLAEARRQMRNGAAGEDVGESLQSGVVGSLKTQRASLASELANLESRYGERHPEVVKTKNQLAEIDRSIRDEIGKIVSGLNARVNVSQQRLNAVGSNLSGARSTLGTSNKALVGFAELSSKAETSQALYTAYLDRYKAAAAQDGTEKAEARVISWAQVPSQPSSPKVTLNIVLAGLLGMGAGLISAFLAELFFTGLTTGEDVETRVGVQYLGSIPLLGSLGKGKGPPIDAIVEKENVAFAEAFRALRAAIGYSSDVHAQVVLITSALPKEGKSTISACLSRIAALENEKVLLIDCDPHRRSVNSMIVERRDAGLFEVLRGDAEIEDALVLDEASGAWLLPFNDTRTQSSDILAGDAMAALIQKLRADFTYIVLDGAPVLPSADTRILATIADAVVFVARWRKVTDHAVKSALKLLPRGRINMAGIVLSQVDIRKQARFGHGDASYYFNQYKEYYS
ncbi:GumC family protein [Sphingomonas crocodyli]|uniref:non-specific protein-tyrosine kinase n=1 Tax=Sphingomonas crocodyli TaxID=1979270 RepID=A0A437LXK9_9SPHN|nr:polysaccharide biosynthesis tyrosine autokinase [Sphingomonas crocodyli]RVT90158.1 hypothetical protein EOD43_17790 [Sphingomonas crocodyli]